ncbi:hypothetical protein [Pyxidicoccus xibeiensis]|uniref:hypothetical protein n=1 Tax=Pyxidicoccus xibeiensis TaxID=2906759 RepID=UPI0020A7E405|nr:hypothetical protein [Pyxidicoccus xibeiensis]MCP3145318.1 hypothetical protein [Pyxidicoccus xibeiensis]
MDWKTAGRWALTAATLAGCSQTFGEGGTLDRALDKDQKNQLDTSRSSPLYRRYCSRGRQDTALCHWAMANPEEAAAQMAEEEE